MNSNLNKLMKTRYPWTLAFTVGGTLGLVAALGSVKATAPKTSEPNVVLQTSLDHSPPERTGPLGGYAVIVDEVSPSVVSIFSTKIAKPSPFPRGIPGMPIPNNPHSYGPPSPFQEGLGSSRCLHR